MPAVLSNNLRTEDSVFSLWASADNGWHHLDTNADESVLRRKVESLKVLFTNKKFVIVPGASSPKS